MKPLPKEMCAEDSIRVIEEAISDEHARQGHSMVGWKTCPEPFCYAMNRAVLEAREILNTLDLLGDEW